MEQSPKQSPAEPLRYAIEHDGFVGTVIGQYTRLDGKRGVVMQQDGTNIVHVYGEKWLKPALPVPAEAAVEPVADLIERIEKIACRHVTINPLWWQIEAREAAASLSQLSTKLENAERERDEARAAVKAVERGMFRTRKRAESAEQERDELRAKLAEARAAAFEEAAQITDEHARNAWEIAASKGEDDICASGRNYAARDIEAAIRARASIAPEAQATAGVAEPKYVAVQWNDDPAEQLAYDLAVELEQADLDRNDYVTVNRAKLLAIATRSIERIRSRAASKGGAHD